MSGGACPEKGGDFAYYPWGNPGSSWPTTYEEVTPICEAFAIDLKFWADLDKSWNDPAVFIGNAGFCLLYTSPSPRDATLSRMPSSA